MNCENCQAFIPPSWANVIAKNQCPNCEKEILSEKTKQIMEDLKNAITSMHASPEELVGWLMATYDLFPKGTVQAASFVRKPGSQPDNYDPTQVKWANTTNPFMKNSGAERLINDPKLANIAATIKLANQLDQEEVQAEQEMDEVSSEEDEAAEQQRITAIVAKAKLEGRKVTAKELLSNAANFQSELSAPMTADKQEILKNIINTATVNHDVEDIANLPPLVQRERLKRLASQREMGTTGSVGKIKRSS